ncbi:tripartite tricarboxylate transporter substrate binding protein [Aureimonas sp. OT7]|uniref:Bug family tripartite tricarboxylate transporter substrate binding protein n=1 Tax=Aureimonas sp. OT7 TaxID=2816454 RepID=UPI00177C84A3|nr:tripartite tricarboxylate transporter substrate-binding protein [Aureimonas sp. OT7]QOG07421.1 tripartite tricarboxylate transporter substrate binding protein [Aureimonas sp. OT7]
MASINRLIGLALATATMLATPALAQDWQPQKPVEFVVASGAGGGTDQFARIIQSIIQKNDLMPVSIVVSNKGGGAGTEAFVDGKLAGNDPHKLVFGTNNEWLLPMVTKAAYGPGDLQPVAAMAMDEFLLWTHADAPYENAADFVAKAKEGNMKVGGSQSKDTDQILSKHLEHATGTKFTYIPFKSGGEAATQLAGAHLEANFNNPQENVAQWRGGMVRPLCVFSPERMDYKEKVTDTMSWNDIPTCKEEGIAVGDYKMPRTIWMNAEVPQEAVAYYADVLSKVREAPEWKEWLARTSQTDSFLTGEAFTKLVETEKANARQLFEREGWLVTN